MKTLIATAMAVIALAIAAVAAGMSDGGLKSAGWSWNDNASAEAGWSWNEE